MELDRNLLKEFAKITNDSEDKSKTTHLRGTIVKNSGGKYVQIDGSVTVTPISEVVDVEEGDRVLVSIENHKATIVGNFSFPPSARKEQQAIDQAGAAQESAGNASSLANSASQKADTAIEQSSIASASAAEAKEQASGALEKAEAANTNVEEAKRLATQASTDAAEAKTQAAASQQASSLAQSEVTRLEGEVTEAQENINKALDDLNSQADEISAIKETYATKVEVGNTKAELTTEISKKVGELETTISETYSTKTENVELEGKLQSQITQNAEGLASQVSKTEKLETDTAQAIEYVDQALAKAEAAEQAAIEAKANADAAQEEADEAIANANAVIERATIARNAADHARQAADLADEDVQEAQRDLAEAQENYENVSNKDEVTAEEIAEAQSLVDTAQTAVNNALAEAAEADYAATQAEEAAISAEQEAETAQGIANTAQQKAKNAQTAASNALIAAEIARKDVAALTLRLTSAETSIIQNSERIVLNANKTEEIGDNLKDNYYTKNETDSKIEIQSDRITSTVTRVETVEKDAIISTIEEFYLSESPTELIGGSWSTEQPEWTDGMYLWRRNYVTKGDGTSSYQPSQNGVCITGNTGQNGETIIPETIKTIEGKEIHITDASNYELINPKLYGETNQLIAKGTNKFDISKVTLRTFTNNDIKYGTELIDNGLWVRYGLNYKTEFIPSYQELLLKDFKQNTSYICTAKVKVLSAPVASNDYIIEMRYSTDSVPVLYDSNMINWEVGKTYELESTFTVPNSYSFIEAAGLNIITQDAELEITELMIREASVIDDTYLPYGESPTFEIPSELNNIEGDINVVVTGDDPTKEQTGTFSLGSYQLMKGNYLADDGIHYNRKKLFLPISELGGYLNPGWFNPGNGVGYFETDETDNGYFETLNSLNEKMESIHISGSTKQVVNQGNKINLEKVRAMSEISDGVTYFIRKLDTGISVKTRENDPWPFYINSYSVTNDLAPGRSYDCTAKVKVIQNPSSSITNLIFLRDMSTWEDTGVLQVFDSGGWIEGNTYEYRIWFEIPEDITNFSLYCVTNNAELEISELQIRDYHDTVETYESYSSEVTPSFDKPSPLISLDSSIDIVVEGPNDEIQTVSFPLNSVPFIQSSILLDEGIYRRRERILLPILEMNSSESNPGWTGLYNGSTFFTELLDRYGTEYPNQSMSLAQYLGMYDSNICLAHYNNGYFGCLTIDSTGDGGIFIQREDGVILTQSEYKSQYPDLVVEIEYGTPYAAITSYTEEQQSAYNDIKNLHTYEGETTITSNRWFSGNYYRYVSDVDRRLMDFFKVLSVVNPDNTSGLLSDFLTYESNICTDEPGYFYIDQDMMLYIKDPKNEDMTKNDYQSQYPDLIVELEYDLPTEEIVPYTTEEQILWDNIKSLYTYNPTTDIYSDALLNAQYYTIYKGEKGSDAVVTDEILEITDNLNNRINQAQSVIEQLSNMISHLVTDENGGSLMTQTPDGWTFNMSTITGNLNAIKDAMTNIDSNNSSTNDALQKLSDLVNDVANKTAYITIGMDDKGDPCIELGKSDNPFKVRITNTAIDFLEGSTRIAYANNNTFYSEKIITKELQIDDGPGFVWRRRASGNLGLTYISG